MHSHRRPRGRIFFEVLCALLVGASFVGAWIQTGAWAFIGPAFVFTLFGLYWSFDMFGRREPAVATVAVEPVAAVAVRVAEPVAQPAEVPEIRFERFETPAEPVPEPAPEPVIEQSATVEPMAVYAPEPAAEAKPKRRAKKAKAAEAVVDPVVESEPAYYDEPAPEPHIEPLFDPQPFARQARPAFGKRPRGPGPRPLPA